MAAFIVSSVLILDPDRFAAYAGATAGLAELHGGEYIVRGPVTSVLEGEAWPGERLVVLRFADAAAARGYLDDDRYRAAKQLREGAARVVLRLIVE